jgi:Tfp pilus assembly protein PilN
MSAQMSSIPVRMGVDLLPAKCRQRLRAGSRARGWAAALAIYAGLVGCTWMATRMPRTGLEAELARVAAEASAREAEIKAVRADVSTLSREVELAREVGEHPDWSRLMALLSREMGGSLVLSRIAVEPDASAGAAARPSAGGSSARAAYRVSISGTGASQAAVSAYVLALEKTDVFTGVTLVSTRARGGAEQNDVVEFSLMCQLAERPELGRRVQR